MSPEEARALAQVLRGAIASAQIPAPAESPWWVSMIDSARAACARAEAEAERLHAAIELFAARLEGAAEIADGLAGIAARRERLDAALAALDAKMLEELKAIERESLHANRMEALTAALFRARLEGGGQP